MQMRTQATTSPASIATLSFQTSESPTTSGVPLARRTRLAPRSLNAASFTPNKERFRNEIPLRDLPPERILAIDTHKPDYLPGLLIKAGFSDEPFEISGAETSYLKIALDRLKEFGGKASESSSAEHIWTNETGIRARLLYTLALREV